MQEAFKHLKPVALIGDKLELVDYLHLELDDGLLVAQSFSDLRDKFKDALMQHRIWERESFASSIPA